MRPLAGQGGVLFGVLRIAHIHHAKYCGTPTVREQYTAVLHQFLLFASSLFVRVVCAICMHLVFPSVLDLGCWPVP